MRHTIKMKTNLKDIALTLETSDIRVLKQQLRFPSESVMELLPGLRKLLVRVAT